MRYKNNIDPQVRRRRYALGWSQSILAAKLQIAGFDISRSGVSKIEARLSYVDDKALLYLAEVLSSHRYNNSSRPDHLAIESTISSRNLKPRDSDMHVFATVYATARKRCSIFFTADLPKMLQCDRALIGDSPQVPRTLVTCDGARYWVRTSDPYRVKVVLYH